MSRLGGAGRSRVGQSGELGRFASPTRSQICRDEASFRVRERNYARLDPRVDYPKSLSPSNRPQTAEAVLPGTTSSSPAKVPTWSRGSPQRQDHSKEYLAANDPQPFYDLAESWSRTQATSRSASPWSRDNSSRTAPQHWGRHVQEQQEGRVNGRSTSPEMQQASSSSAQARPHPAAARTPPPRPIPLVISGACSSSSSSRGAGSSAAVQPRAEHVLREWKMYKRQLQSPDVAFHVSHSSWSSKKVTTCSTTFGTSPRPIGSRSGSGFSVPLFQKQPGGSRTPSRSPGRTPSRSPSRTSQSPSPCGKGSGRVAQRAALERPGSKRGLTAWEDAARSPILDEVGKTGSGRMA